MAKQYGLNEAVDFAAANLVSFGGSFTRLNGQPIDKSQLWYPIWETIEGTEEKTYKTGLERARAYAATNAAFVGQELAVILPEYSAYADTDKTIPADGATVIGTSVTFYGIQNAAGDLKELGSKPLGDNASIAVSEDGTVAIYGFADAGEETLPQKQKDGTIKWVAISAIVQGDGNSVTTLSAADNSVLVEDEAEEGFEGHKYKVQVKRSQAENNAIELKEDGLFVADYSVTMQVREDESGDDHTAFKHYVFSQLGKEIGHVDVPADLVVQSGKVEVKTAAGAWGDAGTYIVLTIANQTDPIYINAKDLVDIYTVADTDTIDMTIDGTEIKAEVKISKESGNSLVAKNDGLYVNAPDIPDVEVGEETSSEATTETVKAITELVANGHTVTPKVVEVATKKGLDDVKAAIGDDQNGLVKEVSDIKKDISDNYVKKAVAEAENGVRFISQTEINKLKALNLDGEEITISGSVNAGQVKELYETVVNIVKGSSADLNPDEEGNQLGLNIEEGAQKNIIESVALPDAVLVPNTNKTITIPCATIVDGVHKSGLVKGSGEVNKISYVDGVGEVNSLSTDKLVQGTMTLVLNAGDVSVVE